MPTSEERGRSGCLGVFVFGIIALVVFGTVVGVVAWRLSRHADASKLTERVAVTVTGARGEVWVAGRLSSEIAYRYSVSGHTYEYHDVADGASWSPGEPLWACVDPRHPATHLPLDQGAVPHHNYGDTCGTKDMGRSPFNANQLN